LKRGADRLGDVRVVAQILATLAVPERPKEATRLVGAGDRAVGTGKPVVDHALPAGFRGGGLGGQREEQEESRYEDGEKRDGGGKADSHALRCEGSPSNHFCKRAGIRTARTPEGG